MTQNACEEELQRYNKHNSGVEKIAVSAALVLRLRCAVRRDAPSYRFRRRSSTLKGTSVTIPYGLDMYGVCKYEVRDYYQFLSRNINQTKHVNFQRIP